MYLILPIFFLKAAGGGRGLFFWEGVLPSCVGSGTGQQMTFVSGMYFFILFFFYNPSDNYLEFGQIIRLGARKDAGSTLCTYSLEVY